jgi:hypothetical protein
LICNQEIKQLLRWRRKKRRKGDHDTSNSARQTLFIREMGGGGPFR